MRHATLVAGKFTRASKAFSTVRRLNGWPQRVQRITEDNIELAYVDQGYTGEARYSGCTPARHRVGGGQACTGQARARAAAAKMGGNVASPGPHRRLAR
jgi:hypothetical protein